MMSHQFFYGSGYARFSGSSNMSLVVTVILMDGICAECSQRFKPLRGIQGNADSIAESDSTRIFIHDFVIAFLKQLAIRVRLFLVMYKNSRVKSDNDLISVSLAKIPSVEMTIEVHTFRKYREHELWSNLSLNRNGKERCEITIISFSRSICRGGLAALIGVTGKPYPRCLSCHSHPIRPCGAPSPRG